jgi:thiamine biosynthesis lipoprotein
VSTSWQFVSLLTATLNAAAATDGLVDPLLGAHLVTAGYDRWAGQGSGITCDPSEHRWESVEIKPGRAEAAVRIPPGSALDLGAVTKGWLADRLAQSVVQSTGADCLANMGGDLRVISPGEPWVIAATDDHWETVMEVTDVGLATSGTGHRAWEDGHHLIDPRTGQPAMTPWSSVSVLAATAADANTASTAAIILGDAGPDWVAGHGLDAWFVGEQRQHTVGQWTHLPVSAA